MKPRGFLTATLVSLVTYWGGNALADCPDGFGPPTVPNVTWTIPDQVTGCPAGDTTSVPGHPSVIRVLVTYQDAACNPRVGVPPESLVIVWQTLSGNARINDKSSNGTFADDSTDYNGQTRFTFRSLSGNGKLRLLLSVSGDGQGSRNVQIRTTDPDIDLERRVTVPEWPLTDDLNWNGVDWHEGDSEDLGIFYAHLDHWRRNALHGTLVKRTSLPETGLPRIGESVISWSPNGNWLTFSIHTVPVGKCKIFTVPSSPTYANVVQKFTTTAPDSSDYDPSWSPLGHEIVFDRFDYRILRKGIPGLAADTSEILVTSSGDTESDGDNTPSVSPDGRSVAFSRRDQVTLAINLWKIPIGGGAATQLTTGTTVSDRYPRWSPDGEWITFDRQYYPFEHRTWRIKASGDSLHEVYFAGSGKNAGVPAFSPDGLIITAAVGTQSDAIADTRCHTIDSHLPTPVPSEKVIVNYASPEHSMASFDPVLSPVMSPDGTRLAIRTKQIYAVRRNMNAPPRFTQVGSQTVHDTTAKVVFNVIAGQTLSFALTATDPDDGARTYHAAYLNQTGMTFSPSSRTFAWVNAGPVGTYYVKFWVTNGAVASGAQNGGMDAIIAVINVTPSLGVGLHASRAPDEVGKRVIVRWDAASAVLTAEAFDAPGFGQLKIFDLSGRMVAEDHGRGLLKWSGVDQFGRRVASGIYLYVMEVGSVRKEGKIALLR